MNTQFTWLYTVKRAFWPVFLAFLCMYFTYHTAHGDRGLFVLEQWNKEIAVAEKELESIKAQRLMMEKRVAALRPQTLDLDYLDELARHNLGYAHPLEKIIIE